MSEAPESYDHLIESVEPIRERVNRQGCPGDEVYDQTTGEVSWDLEWNPSELHDDALELLRQVAYRDDKIERLEERIAKLEEIARAAADITPSHVHSAEPDCFWCGGRLDDDYGRADPHAQTWRHADDCPVTQARKLLGMDGGV